MYIPGIKIQEAPNGEVALEKIKGDPPGIIFMDIHLPGKNGLKLTKEIKEHYPEMIVTMLTNYDLPEYRDMAFKYGADHFLLKDSLSGAELAAMVKAILSNNGTIFQMISMGYSGQHPYKH
jgi:DNA-binding NarL/FixJ family response regulator